MSREQAISLYNQLTNSSIQPDNIPWRAEKAIDALEAVSKMVERQGGKLQSRQIIAAIIHFAEKVSWQIPGIPADFSYEIHSEL